METETRDNEAIFQIDLFDEDLVNQKKRKMVRRLDRGLRKLALDRISGKTAES